MNLEQSTLINVRNKIKKIKRFKSKDPGVRRFKNVLDYCSMANFSLMIIEKENPEGNNKFCSFYGPVLPVRPTCARGRITVVKRW